MPATERGLAEAARRVLRANDTGRWTVPSPAQYPHLWNWDSAFVAIGLATFDWERATVEVEAILAGRWREGMLPHIRYDSRRLGDYFPGPDRWPRAQPHVADSAVRTSGITNPPIAVTAALLVGRRQPDRERRVAFWRRTYPALRRFVEYLASRRRVASSPLVAMVHPWESGWDNSPRWDHLREARLQPRRPYVRRDARHVPAGDRPADIDYDGYLALVELLDEADYDIDAYLEVSPFCVYDVLMDALWHRAARDLDEIAGEIGEAPPVGPSRLAEFAAAFDDHHWDADLGLYVDWDCVARRRIARPTAAGLAALAGGLIAPERARATWERYRGLAAGARLVCTVPPGDPAFDARRYWRGPVWAPVNWLVAEGLEEAGMAAEAGALRAETLALVGKSGFAEYFDPLTGAPCGAGDFSWTAAITLDLLSHRPSGRSPGG
ncbi:MAG TPA: trehalase family glycosidase [Candidatus Dormibacteraeota bacterium]